MSTEEILLRGLGTYLAIGLFLTFLFKKVVKKKPEDINDIYLLLFPLLFLCIYLMFVSLPYFVKSIEFLLDWLISST